MKTLYLECRMGAAGDMLTAALSELTDQQKFIEHMNSFGLEGVAFKAEPSTKCGITGTHVSVVINGEEEESHDAHEHSHMALFSWKLEGLPEDQKDSFLEQVKGIHDIAEVSYDSKEQVLRYAYDHDHGDHAEEHLREILAHALPSVTMVSLGHEHHHHHQEHEHSHMALFSWKLEGLPEDQEASLLEQVKGIHDIAEVSYDSKEQVLRYAYDHDHGDHAEEHLREILTQSFSSAALTSLGHEHHHDHVGGHHHHPHSGMHEIHHILEHLHISEQVRKDAEEVYGLIAEAESHAHNMPVDQIHFHEVGTMDAVADVVAVCTLMEWLKPERIYASPVAVGNGMVHCAHGILPVPAPATAYLLQGIPCYAGRMQGELCTPTGAALLKHFVQSFENMPVMITEKIGYGMGRKDFEAANCVRAFLGETEDDGEVTELVCNLDDISSEAVGFAVEELFAAGALDVYTTPVHMKKNRPGIVFTCMCRMSDKDHMLELMFRHLTTLGIREYTCRRHALHREVRREETSMGTVRVKHSEGYGSVHEKLEYEDLADIARQKDLSLETVRRILEKEIQH